MEKTGDSCLSAGPQEILGALDDRTLEVLPFAPARRYPARSMEDDLDLLDCRGQATVVCDVSIHQFGSGSPKMRSVGCPADKGAHFMSPRHQGFHKVAPQYSSGSSDQRLHRISPNISVPTGVLE